MPEEGGDNLRAAIDSQLTVMNDSNALDSAASVACGKRKRRIEEENREFNQDWTESFAFICNTDGLPTCLLCHEKLAHNKKSNLERHFTTKHTQFADESCDIKDTAQVTLFVRYVSSQGPKELLGLLPLSRQTRGEDVANAVQNCLEDNGIDINKIVSIATDGARSMTGIHRGVTSILQKKINHRGYVADSNQRIRTLTLTTMLLMFVVPTSALLKTSLWQLKDLTASGV
ncbi:hypothetical protein AVEN_93893-1 [Araneus ventricosus]|uniref:DUF4371 domain-containing protein n=1 Tax=Araneus ventricosus TaxID=182803 RepID=A0A4Y2AYJ5_ARAVE|nr:hypothetical protein AVEN_93893-1 [Araneus ventricosus]